MSDAEKNNKSSNELSQENNYFDNKLFRKNAIKDDNNLLPKSLLKDLIEDESSSLESQNDISVDNSDLFPKNYDFSNDCLENQATYPYTNYTETEMKNRASTYNDIDKAKKSIKIADSFNGNFAKDKIIKMQSHNDFNNYSRPVINNNDTINFINNPNNITNLNTLNSTSTNNLINNLKINNLNCDENQNYILKNNVANNNVNSPNINSNFNAFNSLSRSSSINQSNNLQNLNLQSQNMNMLFNISNIQSRVFSNNHHQNSFCCSNNNGDNQMMNFQNINSNNFPNNTNHRCIKNYGNICSCSGCTDEDSFNPNTGFFNNQTNNQIHFNECLNNKNNSAYINNMVMNQNRTFSNVNHSMHLNYKFGGETRFFL